MSTSTIATDSAAELNNLIGEDATSTFESDPKFIDADPTGTASSDNVAVQRESDDTEDSEDEEDELADEEDDDDLEDEDLEEEDDEEDDDEGDVDMGDEEEDDEDEDDNDAVAVSA